MNQLPKENQTFPFSALTSRACQLMRHKPQACGFHYNRWMDYPVRLLVFDLDGTLVDSKEDLANAVNVALESYDLPPLPHRRSTRTSETGRPR